MRLRDKILGVVLFICFVLITSIFIIPNSPRPTLPWIGKKYEPAQRPSSSAANATPSRTLAPLALTPLPLGSIRPQGWLLTELQASAAGLAGHEYDFYKFVAQSPWLGGTEEYAALHEGFPYWFNGLVALAYSLDDERLKRQVHEAAEYVLEHQQEDGWIGPERGQDRNLWARYPLFLGLTGLAEGNATWEGKIVSSLRRFVGLMHGMLKDGGKGYLYHDGDSVGQAQSRWGRLRVTDLILTLQWLYEKHPGDQGTVLWECMEVLYDGMIRWEGWPEAGGTKYRVELENDEGVNYTHGVNFVQSFKSPGVIYRISNQRELIEHAKERVELAFKDYAAPSGAVIADEHLAGNAPYRGSELCTVVETIFSLSQLYRHFGDNTYADLAERVTYNALPAMLAGDWWAHQYMSQSNQPFSFKLEKPPYDNVDGWAQTFGLEPTYPCCTVNFPQGLPKFLAASWATIGEDGVAHVLLSPGNMITKLKGGKVEIQCETHYPFGELLEYSISSEVSFDFYLRVPGWDSGRTQYSHITQGNGPEMKLSPDPKTGLHKIHIENGESTISYHVDAQIRKERRSDSSISVYAGALLFALEINSTNSSTTPHIYRSDTQYPISYAPSSSRDWKLVNASSWSVAIDADSIKGPFSSSYSTELNQPFNSSLTAPIYLTAKVCEVEWPFVLPDVPDEPPTTEGVECAACPFDVRLVPYGSAKLHMAELPEKHCLADTDADGESTKCEGDKPKHCD